MTTTPDTEVVDVSRIRQKNAMSSRVSLWIMRVAFILALLLLWDLISRVFDLDYWISTPTEVGRRLLRWIETGYLWPNLVTTLQEALIGFVLGAALGIAVGIVLGLMRRLAQVTEPVVVALYSMPKIALAPLLIVWIGIGVSMKVALAAISCFFLILFNTLAGVKAVDQELLNVIRLMGGHWRHGLKEVVLPTALVWVFVGLRVSMPYALIGAVTGEIITSNRGIGYLLTYAGNQLDTTGVMAGLIVLSIVGLVLYLVIALMERLVLRWK